MAKTPTQSSPEDQAADTKVAAKKAPAKNKAATTTKPAAKKASPKSKAASAEKPAATKTAEKASASGPSQASSLGISAYVAKKGEEYMNTDQQNHFRAMLEAWRRQLMEEVDRPVDFMRQESTSLPDVNDRATQEEEFAVSLRTRDRERKLLKKIAKSLTEIDAGDYGYCETCGTDIGLKRLEARPTATQCIDCKTLAEIKERQEHGGL